MNDQELLQLAESMLTMDDAKRLDYLNSLSTMPEAEDLASVQKLIDEINSQVEEACDTTEAPEVA